MNCQSILSGMGFDCQELGNDTLRLWSPFTYGHDGEVVGLYVEKQEHGYFVSDYAEAMMHASSMGIKLNDRRVEVIRRASSKNVQISTNGVISATTGVDDLQEGIADVLNAALAVSHFETLWAPRTKGEPFSRHVAEILAAEVGDRLMRDVKVTGASGHQLEIPFAVRANGFLTYIQTIASGDHHVDWKNVYAGYGKMMDIKNAGAENDARVVVLEDAPGDADLVKAVSLLSLSSTVVQAPRLREWARKHAA